MVVNCRLEPMEGSIRDDVLLKWSSAHKPMTAIYWRFQRFGGERLKAVGGSWFEVAGLFRV